MFDFDATLPLMAVQFLLLTVILNAVFFKPMGKIIGDREDFIRSSSSDTRDRLEKAKQLATQYETDLADTRRQSQAIIAEAQEEAKRISATQIAEAQQQAQAELTKVLQEIDQQKQTAMGQLSGDVENLSQQILGKLLGSAA
jgi:F-type H+-transporting ATPase subunit b